MSINIDKRGLFGRGRNNLRFEQHCSQMQKQRLAMRIVDALRQHQGKPHKHDNQNVELADALAPRPIHRKNHK